jgi:Tol biopolymer transport system component
VIVTLKLIGLALAATATLLLWAGPASAAFPGKPGSIAYSKTDFREGAEGLLGTGGIFAHGPRRAEAPRRLTTDTGDHSPSYSADGRLIVFVRDDEVGRRSSIQVMRSDGSEVREVTGHELGGGGGPVFFPSGRAIAFTRMVDGHNQIFSIRLDGSGLRQLTRGPNDSYDPVVSPNGRRIAFTSDRDPDGRRDRSDIFTMRADGSRVRILIDGPRSEAEPDWAPDGRRIAFISNRNLGVNVFVARADGRRVRQVTICKQFPLRCRDFHHPVFSPDGRHIAVLNTATRTSGIDVMRTDGRGSSHSFDDAGTEEEGFGSRLGVPTWGPRPR